MRAVDTSAWIEWLIESPTGDLVDPELPDREDLIVPTLVQFELAKWLLREIDPRLADRIMSYTQLCVVVPLDTEIALQAAKVCRAHRLATADAIIYAMARECGADLLTCDAHFAALPGVVFVPKRTS